MYSSIISSKGVDSREAAFSRYDPVAAITYRIHDGSLDDQVYDHGRSMKYRPIRGEWQDPLWQRWKQRVATHPRKESFGIRPVGAREEH
jgi:hypothetical protein